MTYPERLTQLNMFSSGFRRVRGDLIYTWRTLNGMLGEDVKGYFSIVSDSSTRSHWLKLFKPRRMRLDPCMALSSRVVNLWNALPADIVGSTTEAEFKCELDSHFHRRTTACCQLSNIQIPMGWKSCLILA